MDEDLKSAKKVKQEWKTEHPKSDFPDASKEVNYIFDGPDSYESKRKYKLTAREVMTVGPATPEYPKWSPGFCPKAGPVPSYHLPYHQGCQDEPSPHWWREFTQHPFPKDIRSDGFT
jgi:hypothetical protein